MPDFVFDVLPSLPLIVAYLVGIVLVSLRLSELKSAGYVTLAALGLLLAVELFQALAWRLMQQVFDNPNDGLRVLVVNGLPFLMRLSEAVGVALVVLAIYMGRHSPSPNYAMPLPPPAAGGAPPVRY